MTDDDALPPSLPIPVFCAIMRGLRLRHEPQAIADANAVTLADVQSVAAAMGTPTRRKAPPIPRRRF